MYSIQEVSSIDLTKIPKPDFSYLKGVKVGATKRIKLNQIHWDDSGSNIRFEGTFPAHVESLKMSFAEGINMTKMPPGVIKRQGNVKKPYELIYGFHRVSALQELNADEYFFTEIEVENDSVKMDVQIAENDELPKMNNAEIDIKNAISWKIQNGYLVNSETSIRKEIKRILPYIKKVSIDRVVQTVISVCNTPQKFQFYSPSKAQSWLDNNSSKEYVIGGYDEERDMYGYLVKEGYQYRFVMNAIRNYAQEGKKSYCIVHVGSPSGNSTIEAKRKQFVDELDVITDNFLTVSNGGTVCWEVMGFLPQIYDQEDWKTLITKV